MRQCQPVPVRVWALSLYLVPDGSTGSFLILPATRTCWLPSDVCFPTTAVVSPDGNLRVVCRASWLMCWEHFRASTPPHMSAGRKVALGASGASSYLTQSATSAGEGAAGPRVGCDFFRKRKWEQWDASHKPG